MASLPNLSALDGALVAPTGGNAGRRARSWYRESDAEKTVRLFFENHTEWKAEEHKSDKWWTEDYIKKLNKSQDDNIERAHHYAYRMLMGSSERYWPPGCELIVVYAGRSTLTAKEAETSDGGIELTMRRKVKRVTKAYEIADHNCLKGAAKTGFVELKISVNAYRKFNFRSHEFQPADGEAITLEPKIYKISVF